MPMLQNMQKNLTSVQNLHNGFTVALVGETLAPKHSDTTKGVLKDLILTHPRMDEKVFGPHPSCRDFFKTLRAAVNSTRPISAG